MYVEWTCHQSKHYSASECRSATIDRINATTQCINDRRLRSNGTPLKHCCNISYFNVGLGRRELSQTQWAGTTAQQQSVTNHKRYFCSVHQSLCSWRDGWRSTGGATSNNKLFNQYWRQQLNRHQYYNQRVLVASDSNHDFPVNEELAMSWLSMHWPNSSNYVLKSIAHTNLII